MSHFSKSCRTTLQALHTRKQSSGENQPGNFIFNAVRAGNKT